MVTFVTKNIGGMVLMGVKVALISLLKCSTLKKNRMEKKLSNLAINDDDCEIEEDINCDGDLAGQQEDDEFVESISKN